MKNFKKYLLLAAMAAAAGVAGAAQPKFNIYLGNTHAHCNYSGDFAMMAKKAGKEGLDPRNDVDKTFIEAKKAGYQFYCMTDHSQYECYDAKAWADVADWANKLTENGKFVALRGFEYSRHKDVDGAGHANVYNTSGYISSDVYDLHGLQNWLTLPENKDAIVGFNHPGRPERQFNKFAVYNEAAKSKFTMCEVLTANEPKNYYSGFLMALEAGYKVSPTAGVDNHDYTAIAPAPSRTGIAATELTQKGVLEAFAARRTYATLDKDLKIYYTVNDQPMGSTLTAPKGDLKFAVDASTPNAISKIDIIGEGNKAVLSKDFDSGNVKWAVSVPQGQKYYYLIVYEKGAETPIAWVAPVWVE